MRVYSIPDQVYQQKIFLVVGADQKTLQSYLRKKYPNFEDKDKNDMERLGTTTGAYFTVENKKYGILHRYIVLQKFNWLIDEQALLVHELDHARDDMLEYVGVDIKDQEARAYFLQYLFREVYRKLRAYHPNIKRKKRLVKA